MMRLRCLFVAHIRPIGASRLFLSQPLFCGVKVFTYKFVKFATNC
jgi:hypothetical protein